MGGQLAADWEHRRVSFDSALKRLFDIVGAGLLLVVISPLFAGLAIAVKLESRGPVFYRCRRVGFRGRELHILKFRKMHEDATGPALTVSADERLTRVGRFVARAKLDELPQLWNVLKGEMSLVGPRPEDPSFVKLRPDDFDVILAVKPGITGLSQLAFAKESELLNPVNRVADYLERFLPHKIALDRLYVSRRTIWVDLRILTWTVDAVLLRREVAVNRQTTKLTRRKRPPAAPKLGVAPVGR
jgi:lipopolysaccharide/colanic/teichoic acid biosynthesis glycosyltransferase